MAQKPKPRLDLKNPKNARVVKLAEQVRAEVRKRHGTELTYEQRRDAAAEVMAEVLWADGEKDLKELVTDDDEVEIDGKRYRRLDQASSGVYYGRWGPHEVEEPLYREIGVHNGPTIKPIERRVGMVTRRMTPDLARIVGEISADGNSREVEKIMRTTGLVPPSRSFLEKHLRRMAGEIAEQIEELEAEARALESLPDEVASVSCGMDRMAVRMSEPHPDPENAPKRRTEPYERKPPEPREHNWRMAWVGTSTAYNDRGEALATWRYAAEADAAPSLIARRVSADVAHLVSERPEIPVHCVQDGAPELRILPTTIRSALPQNAVVRELVDFEHLAGYLDDVVDACEPAGDPADMKGWYRSELLRDDHAIERIWRNLRRKSKTLPRDASPIQRQAVAAALSYIRKRKNKMRYASLHAAKLTIGSGATEGTCGLMQLRVKRRGQSWEPPGLRGILTVRGLVLSERWDAAWRVYAAKHRADIRKAA
jgi:hypothetical protein